MYLDITVREGDLEAVLQIDETEMGADMTIRGSRVLASEALEFLVDMLTGQVTSAVGVTADGHQEVIR